MYRISSLFKAVFWCVHTDVGALVQIASCDYGSYEEIPVGPFASSDDSGAPFEVGSSFENGCGRMNSTMMDGPAVALDSGSAFSGLVEIRAASLVGDSHVQTRLRRQDAYAVHVAQDSARIELVVCDGVGSRTRSNEGASIVATTVAGEAAFGNPDPLNEARSLLVRRAELAGIPAIEYSTTLIWVEVTLGAPGDAWLARLVHYGDGEVRLLNRQQCQWRSVCQSDHVDEVDDRSFALPLATQPRWEYEFSWQPGDVLVLATEGIAYYLDSETKVGHYLSRSWCSPPDRWAFLNDVAFRTLGAGDDRTAVALWRTDVKHIAGSSELSVGGSI